MPHKLRPTTRLDAPSPLQKRRGESQWFPRSWRGTHGRRLDACLWDPSILVRHRPSSVELKPALRDSTAAYQTFERGRRPVVTRRRPSSMLCELTRSPEKSHHSARRSVLHRTGIGAHGDGSGCHCEPRAWTAVEKVRFAPPSTSDTGSHERVRPAVAACGNHRSNFDRNKLSRAL